MLAPSDTFEMVERFEAVAALPLRLARGRAELADQRDMGRLAARAAVGRTARLAYRDCAR